jgi:hypothetical protein
MIHAAIWVVSLCVVLFFIFIIGMLILGALGSINKENWIVVAAFIIFFVVLGNFHYHQQVTQLNKCQQQVFQQYPHPSVQDGTFDGYANALGYCNSRYSFWHLN